MSIKQNNFSKLKNRFVAKEQTHNYLGLLMAILLFIFASVALWWSMQIPTYMIIPLVIIFYIFSIFKIITNSLLITKLKKIKNKLEPKRLNFYIYQSSWMRKKIATFWTTLDYFTIFCFLFLICLIIMIATNQYLKFVIIFYCIIIIGTIIIGFINYKIIKSNLLLGKRYISANKISTYDNTLDLKQWNIFFKKIYVYLCFTLLIFPWILMLNSKFNFFIFNIINNVTKDENSARKYWFLS